MAQLPDQAVIRGELERGRQARLSGNEGRARVHARRAAGWAVGMRALGLGLDLDTSNALRLLEWFAEDPSVAASLRQSARRLTVHITDEHRLPHDQDPLDDAELIVRACLAEIGSDRAPAPDE